MCWMSAKESHKLKTRYKGLCKHDGILTIDLTKVDDFGTLSKEEIEAANRMEVEFFASKIKEEPVSEDDSADMLPLANSTPLDNSAATSCATPSDQGGTNVKHRPHMSHPDEPPYEGYELMPVAPVGQDVFEPPMHELFNARKAYRGRFYHSTQLMVNAGYKETCSKFVLTPLRSPGSRRGPQSDLIPVSTL